MTKVIEIVFKENANRTCAVFYDCAFDWQRSFCDVGKFVSAVPSELVKNTVHIAVERMNSQCCLNRETRSGWK